MNRVQLEISSEKHIILGTYDMAQEGLDIPDLTLRWWALYQPLIIDIIDQIKPFSKQARTRYGYYKANNYSCSFYEVSDWYSIENKAIRLLKQAFLLPTIKSQKLAKDEDLFDD